MTLVSGKTKNVELNISDETYYILSCLRASQGKIELTPVSV